MSCFSFFCAHLSSDFIGLFFSLCLNLDENVSRRSWRMDGKGQVWAWKDWSCEEKSNESTNDNTCSERLMFSLSVSIVQSTYIIVVPNKRTTTPVCTQSVQDILTLFIYMDCFNGLIHFGQWTLTLVFFSVSHTAALCNRNCICFVFSYFVIFYCKVNYSV